jgi:thioredoxin reductase (NADPH)
LKRDPFLLETSVPGVFAAGDVRQGAIRRVASAVGEGAIAVSFIHQYLKTV